MWNDNAGRFKSIQKERNRVGHHVNVRQILFPLQHQQIVQIIVTLDFLVFPDFDRIFHQFYEESLHALRDDFNFVEFLNYGKNLQQQEVNYEYGVRFEYWWAHFTDGGLFRGEWICIHAVYATGHNVGSVLGSELIENNEQN